MVKAILFDLDGTLLPMDTDRFINYYINELSKYVAKTMDPELFVKALLAGTEAMIKNVDPKQTNERVFEETFIKQAGVNKEDIWPILNSFYETVFPTFSHLTAPTALAKEVIEEATNQGYKVAVATNPLFPRVAILHRLKWAGLDEELFGLITVYEESSFTKPHPEYYQEICGRLEVKPEECIMIGNDKQEDMVASQIGMKTYLVEGYVIDRGEPSYTIDDQGTLEELIKKLRQKEGIFSVGCQLHR